MLNSGQVNALNASPAASFFFARPMPVGAADSAISEQSRRADGQFVAMLDAYRPSGGLARLQELATLRCGDAQVDVNRLASCISRRELICFEWQSHAWLPLFQFNAIDMTPLAPLQPVLVELSCRYDPWELAQWFSQPNPWLAGQAPADTLLSDLAAVLQAARADRFVAN